MHPEDECIEAVHLAVLKRFGPAAFVRKGSEPLGSNHLVFQKARGAEIEISVVAGGPGQAEDRYSVQVEVNPSEQDFDIPLVAENLTLDDVLDVFAEYEDA